MAAEEGVVTMSYKSDVQESIIKPYRSSYPGPIELCIKECRVLDQGGKPARVIKEGDPFYLCMDVYYSELLGDLEADFVAEFHVMDLASCDYVKTYCCSVKGKLHCDTTCARICCKFKCTQKGIFTYAASIYLPCSDLFDFCCHEECFACQPDCCHAHPKKVKINTPVATTTI